MCNFLINSKYLLEKFNQLRHRAQNRGLPEPEIQSFMGTISRVFEMKKFRKGELLFHDGEKGDYMLMVLQGSIECAIKKTPEEKNISRGFLLKAFSDLKSSYYTKKTLDQKIKEEYPSSVFKELEKGGEDVDHKLKDILFYRKELRVISESEALMIGLGQNEFTPGLKESENRRYYGGGLFNYKIVFSAKEGAIIGE